MLWTCPSCRFAIAQRCASATLAGLHALSALVTCGVIALVITGCATTARSNDPNDQDGSTADASQADVSSVVPDAASIEFDATVTFDATPVTGTGKYLDRCTSLSDCQSALCTEDLGGTTFCTRTCTGDSVCADEHFCALGICEPDDTGRPCSTSTPETCGLGLCLGTTTGSGACTRPCVNATECPAGYGCTYAGGSLTKICVNIEKPCDSADDCGTGLCLSTQGCTATCETAADCPLRLEGLPAYTCEIAYGSASPICVPPWDINGSDAMGTTCTFDGSGYNYCRSDVCDTGAPLGPMCTQACTAEGGCGPSMGCFPLVEGAEIYLVCELAGTSDLGETCDSGRDCVSGLCDADSLSCTRLCQDGLCPTGWTCQPILSTGVAICRE